VHDDRQIQPEPLVSVVIPAWNSERTLAETLQSVVAQTFSRLDIVVVDDGSTDDTANIVNRFRQSDPRIRLAQQPRSGVASARNKGISLSRGSYVAPIDADDVWAPQKIEKQLEAFFKAPPSVGLVYTWTREIDETGKPLGSMTPEDEGDVFLRLMLVNMVGHGSGPLIRRECFEQVGAYNTNFFPNGAQGCEDWDLYLRIARKFDFALVREVLVDYRVSGNSMSQRLEEMRRSFQIMQENVRASIPEVTSGIMRWAASNFCVLLSRKAAERGDYRTALIFHWRACGANPARLLQLGTYRTLVFLCSGGKLGSGKRRVLANNGGGAPAGVPKPARRKLFTRLQERVIRQAAEALRETARGQ
jgi:glycosyltransferase involved in cell wall biosynthesis